MRVLLVAVGDFTSAYRLQCANIKRAAPVCEENARNLAQA